MSPPRPLLPSAVALAAAAALSACAILPPGIRAADPDDTDRVAVRAPPGGWKTIAVLPFAGDPAHRRPAEELVAFVLRRSVHLAVVAPFAVERSSRAAAFEADGRLAAVERCAGAHLDSAAPAEACDDALAIGARTGADAIVIGRVAAGGGATDLVLVDALSGEAVAVLRRAGSAHAAARGVHELAMSSTGRALEDLVTVLRTREGEVPRVETPEERVARRRWEAP